MLWNYLKRVLPGQSVIIEAIDAHTEDDNRIIEDIQLVDVFGKDSIDASRRYAQLHKVKPWNEYYVFHTGRPELNVKVRNWVGVRPAR